MERVIKEEICLLHEFSSTLAFLNAIKKKVCMSTRKIVTSKRWHLRYFYLLCIPLLHNIHDHNELYNTYIIYYSWNIFTWICIIAVLSNLNVVLKNVLNYKWIQFIQTLRY